MAGRATRHQIEWLAEALRRAAADLGVSLNTAYKWSSRGQPDFPRTVRLRNGAVRIRDDWYEEWLSRLEK
jgi:predicted DNA-binding transcriptional regulator AlpA